MNKYDWVFFDFDGTLVDSFSILYDVYDEFLNDFGKSGSKKEFESINGPNIQEIVTQLKKSHDLSSSENELLKKYTQKIEYAYQDKIKPFDDRTSLLNHLKKNGFKMAIVTSAGKKIIEKFIAKHNWNSFFDILITGDEVIYSKPQPEIYLKCLEKTNADKNRVLVLEDSQNGYHSATKAGLNCLLISKNIDKNIFYE